MKVKIAEENRVDIESVLKAVNGRAKRHTFTRFEHVQDVVNEAEARLDALDVPVSYRPRIRAAAASRLYLPDRCRFTARRTEVTIQRGHSAWFLIGVASGVVGTTCKPPTDWLKIEMSNQQLHKIGERLASKQGGLTSRGKPSFFVGETDDPRVDRERNRGRDKAKIGANVNIRQKGRYVGAAL